MNQSQTIHEYKHQLKREVEDSMKRDKQHRSAAKAQARQFELLKQKFSILKTEKS